MISQDGSLCILKIPKFTKVDAGIYKCVASNSAGSAECQANAILYGKSRPLIL